jgi:hypothetical protein
MRPSVLRMTVHQASNRHETVTYFGYAGGMTSSIPSALPPANDNSDPYETAGGAYFDLLRVRRGLLERDTAAMTADAFARWQASFNRIEGLLRELRFTVSRSCRFNMGAGACGAMNSNSMLANHRVG